MLPFLRWRPTRIPVPARRPTGDLDSIEPAHQQVRQLIKQALDAPSADDLKDYLNFATRFRRMAVWNTRMIYIQRPGARVIASEYEWSMAGRYVVPDAVPIIILWPFSPIRFVYELADTGPPIDRENFKDPFAVTGEFHDSALSILSSNLKKQKTFEIQIELRRQGFSYAGSASAHGLADHHSCVSPLDDGLIGAFAHNNATISEPNPKVNLFRITINDRLKPKERFATLAHELGHIFCGHLGGCTASAGREQDESGWPDRRPLGKHEKEIEAEAIAFLIAARAGLTTRSAEYLAVHAQRADIGDIDIDLVVRAAARIERLAKIHYGRVMFRQ